MRKASVWSAIAYQRARKSEHYKVLAIALYWNWLQSNKGNSADDDKLSSTRAAVSVRGTNVGAADARSEFEQQKQIEVVHH